MLKGSYEDFFAALRQRESSGDYQVVNTHGFLGAYQFGEAALVDLGFVTNDGSAFDNEFNGTFTGKFGVFSVEDFLNSVSAQDQAATEWFSLLWSRIRFFDLEFFDGQTLNGTLLTKTGMIAGAHLLGVGGLRDFIQSGGVLSGADGFGTSIVEYITLLGNYDSPSSFLNNLEKDNQIAGGTGNDILVGFEGNDSLSGSSGRDFLDGGAGRDDLFGNGGDDELAGGTGNDLIEGGGGKDLIFGGDGADMLIGGDGPDDIFGGAGNDTISGRRGSDDIFAGAGIDFVTGRGLRDVIFGGSGNDELRGNGGNDSLYGEEGNDILVGGQGNDLLYGGSEDDFLDGRAGNDTLSGGAGTDILTGKAGSDTFIFEEGHQQVEITDFQNDQDILDLTSYDFSDIAAAINLMSNTGSDVVFVSGDDVLTINNMTIGELVSDIVI